MIFQDSGAMMNPTRKVGDVFVEYLRTHEKISKKDAWAKGCGMLEKMNLPSPDNVMKSYPFQLLRHTPLEAEIHWHILNEESFFWARRHGNRSPDDKGKHNRKEQHKTVVAKKLSKIHFFSIFHHFVFFHA